MIYEDVMAIINYIEDRKREGIKNGYIIVTRTRNKSNRSVNK